MQLSLDTLRSALRHVTWMGGSPCSGKSTIADTLVNRYGLRLYRCDDAFWTHARMITPDTQPVFHRVMQLSAEDLWMRPVEQQVSEEIEIYREEFPLILADLLALPDGQPVLAEGAALMPAFVAPLLDDARRAIWITPSRDFQYKHYARRAWTRDVVQACSDPDLAFQNWMERDARFAETVRSEAAARCLPVLFVDGQRSIAEIIASVEEHFLFWSST